MVAFVGEAVAALKKRGFDSPYLRNFVVAQINPLRGTRGSTEASVDEVLDKMAKKAEAFDPAKVSEEQIQAGSGGGGGGEEGGE